MKLDSDNPLALEIQQEMAAAYFAACRKMVDSLDALLMFDTAAAAVGSEEMMRRTCLVEEAAERVFFVLIQREAMRLSHDPAFFEHYGVPDEVRARLGRPRRLAVKPSESLLSARTLGSNSVQ
jgi:hypothetical protein